MAPSCSTTRPAALNGRRPHRTHDLGQPLSCIRPTRSAPPLLLSLPSGVVVRWRRCRCRALCCLLGRARRQWWEYLVLLGWRRQLVLQVLVLHQLLLLLLHQLWLRHGKLSRNGQGE